MARSKSPLDFELPDLRRQRRRRRHRQLGSHGQRAPDVAAVLAEAQQVIDAAQAQSPGPRAPLDEGGAWDALLQLQPEGDWTVVTLTLTGPWEWGEALLAALAPDA